MNVNRKHRGLGKYQVMKQIWSESIISQCLDHLSKNIKFNEKDGYFFNSWISLRGLERRTGLHHSTISKAVKRMKDKGEIIETQGTHNSRIFSSFYSANAERLGIPKAKHDPIRTKILKKARNSDVF